MWKKASVMRVVRYALRFRHTVMHAMMLGCIQKPIKRFDITNKCCMQTQLIYQIELFMTNKVRRWYKQREGQVKYLQNE